MKLSDREWKEFNIRDIFKPSVNSKAYHMNNLNEASDDEKGIPYITRTNVNNGLQCLVKKQNAFNKNPKNTICFGAENAKYFYQSFEYITGNKIYYYENDKFSENIMFFILNSLNKAISNCGDRKSVV